MARVTQSTTATLTTNPRLTTLLSSYLDIQATLRKLQEEAKELLAEMKPLAFKAHTKGQALETDTHIVRYVEATSAESIDKAKLLKLLTAKQLKACTKPGTDYSYVGIYPKKEDTPSAPPRRRASRR